MLTKRKAKITTLALAACIAFSQVPSFADDAKHVTVSFKDVTASDATTLSGEAKILVSVQGASGNVSIAQTALDFGGDLNYKSVRYLKGADKPEEGDTLIPVNAGSANKNKKFTTGIISAKNGINFGDSEDMLVLTFSGEPGKSVTLTLSDLENTNFTIDGKEVFPEGGTEITATASEKENRGKTATVKLTMDKVTSFSGADGTGITIKITSEKTENYSVYTVLDGALISKGGHRDGTSTVPKFSADNTVLADDTYMVEVSGIGYVTYKKTGVTFDEPLEITNADFIPGDVNNDGKVTAEDKAAVTEYINNGEINEAADFNRDGKVDSEDLTVFDGIADDKTTPGKMAKPTVTGGAKKIAVKWSKSNDVGITGYTVKYGTDSASLSGSREISGADTLSTDLTGLSSGTTYYVRVAAKNENGTGEFSDLASAKTSADGISAGGTGSGGTVGGGSGNGGTGGGNYTPVTLSNPNTAENGEVFTDLENHVWAKDAIYSLKEKGIISGISETEFAPGSNIKRGDFILILTRMLSVNDEFTENFADVKVGTYYYNAIGSAKSAGIAKGSGENFMPENSITRQDLITLAYRAFLAKGYISEAADLSALAEFNDKDSISEYASTAMASMVGAGIIKGSDGNVNPLGNATRAEVAALICRFAKLEGAEAENMFPDIDESHWAYNYIISLSNSGLMQGYEDKTYRPENNITRAEVMTVINKILGRNPSEEYVKTLDFNPFSDLLKDKWYYTAVLEATVTHNYYLSEDGVEIKWEDCK